MTARDVLAGTVTEADFQQTVIQYARLHGWKTYHTHDSRRSDPGFPDLIMLRRGRMVVAELKRQGRYPTAAQREWLTEFGTVAATVDDLAGIAEVTWLEGLLVGVFVWRPSDMDTIIEVLR